MDFILHLNIYMFPMILLLVIVFSMRKNPIQTMHTQLFTQLLLATILLLFTDLLSWISNSLLSLVINMIFFALTPLVSIMWLNYLTFCFQNKTIFKYSLIKKGLLICPLILYYFMLIVTPITHWIFQINLHGQYERGTFFLFPYILSFFYMMISFILCLLSIEKNGLSTQKNKALSYAGLTLIPLFSTLIQNLFLGIWISLPITAVVEFLLYLDFQNQQVTTDSLTRLNNRGCFDIYLRDAVTQPRFGFQLYLFMMDLNHFKAINDTYGHAVGDQALVQTADILRKCLHNNEGFLSRYGGDEFALIRFCENDRVAQEFANQIQRAFITANNELNLPYSLSISIGFAHLHKEWGTPVKTLIETADVMMYQNKKGGR